MLDNRIASKEFVDAGYTVEGEAYTEEVDDFVKEGSVWFVSLTYSRGFWIEFRRNLELAFLLKVRRVDTWRKGSLGMTTSLRG
jgi:hypothetical protein